MTAPALSCDLCIIGAGIAGLNALVVAAGYLPKGARVVLVDRNTAPGGMWNGTYDYVRLHQPHPMFTAGDITWRIGKPRDYLATRPEVQAHLAHCLETVRGHFDLVTLYGHSFVASAEQDTPQGPRATASCTDPAGAPVMIETPRLIDARGLNVPHTAPLKLASAAVHSTTPQALGDIALNTPVYVVGGGKTGMDTITRLLDQNPSRAITLINGVGTVFADRDLFLPKGIASWWRGRMFLATFIDIATRFDGTNQDAVFDYFRKTMTVSLNDNGQQYLFGLISQPEQTRIASGLAEVVPGYLADVIDTDTGPQIVLRGGTQIAVPAGSAVVNCTGHLLRAPQDHAPYRSPLGTTVTVNSRSAVHFLSSVAGYFLAHLFFLGKLADTPLYAVDGEALRRKDRNLMQMTLTTASVLNTLLLIDALPFKAVDRCGLDLDRWYPLHRRLVQLVQVMARRKQIIAHCTRVLDKVHRDHGLRGGVPPR